MFRERNVFVRPLAGTHANITFMELFPVSHLHVLLQRKDIMSTRNHNRHRRNTIRLESLESRELLSTVGLPGRQAAEVSPLRGQSRRY